MPTRRSASPSTRVGSKRSRPVPNHNAVDSTVTMVGDETVILVTTDKAEVEVPIYLLRAHRYATRSPVSAPMIVYMF